MNTAADRTQLLNAPLKGLCEAAAAKRDRAFGRFQTFAAMARIPLMSGDGARLLSPEDALTRALEAKEHGRIGALLTLNEGAEQELAALGHANPAAYLAAVGARVLKDSGLLPHIDAGVATFEDMQALRTASVTQTVRLGGSDALRHAGALAIPLSARFLADSERGAQLDALFALAQSHAECGHVQSCLIVPAEGSAQTDLLWTIAAARLILDEGVSIAAQEGAQTDFVRLIDAGVNDWDVQESENAALRAALARRGKALVPRLPIHPAFMARPDHWLAAEVRPFVLRHADADGHARDDQWFVGGGQPVPPLPVPTSGLAPDPAIARALRVIASGTCDHADIVTLFRARDVDVDIICAEADRLRADLCGDTVTYAVNRNINYTNICLHKCGFCAFSKGSMHEDLRGRPYDLDMAEVVRRTREAADRGATEVCLQGGIHPHYDGNTYLAFCRAVKAAVPEMHIHAFSPLEVYHGATTLGLSLAAFLTELKGAGLSSLPGTAAEILDDDIRAIICPDKLTTAQWTEVVETAHSVGLRTTSTIMFGHVESIADWATHLLHIRALQQRTGGITEFVPLPFVHMEAPIALRGQARSGPTFREVRLMHAVARLVLSPLIHNIQASWTKLGTDGAAHCLNGGVNDLGGTLMNESISRAAGSQHGQELPPEAMQALIRSIGRAPLQRTTLYGEPPAEWQARSLGAAPLEPVTQTPPRKHPRKETEPA